MKNKKGIKWYWNIGTLLGFLLVIGLFGLIFFNNEPEFKITKEECWNEKNSSIINEAEKIGGHARNLNGLYFQGNCDSEIKCFPHEETKYAPEMTCIELSNETCFELEKQIENLYVEYFILVRRSFNETFQVCKQVEVDEILDEKYHYWFILKNRSSKTTDEFEKNQCISIKGVWVENKDYFSCLKKSSKQDLSIEFLDENCECIEVYDKIDDRKEHEVIGYKSYLEKECKLYTNSRDFCERLENLKCSKYKCGEYFVEVLN